MVVIVVATSLMIVFAAGKRMAEAAAGSLIASASSLGQVQEVRAWSRTAEIEARKLEAQARKAEREADVLTIIARQDEAVYIRDAGHIPWRPAHLDPRTYANGRASLRSPSPLELSAWNNWHISRQITDSNPRIELDRPQTKLPDRIDLLDWLPASRQGNLRSIFLGLRVDDETGQVKEVTAPIWQLVHVANGGATDSGKSNMIRSIAYQVTTAHQAQVVMIDLKRQTFKVFRGCENLLYPIVTDVQDFLGALGELRVETEKRLALFEPHLTVETIHDYNRIAAEPLPYIVVFVDEISNVFQNKVVQPVFLELIRISRAAGIYFICAGQTWSHRTLSTGTRDQFRTRLHFGTNDPRSSRMLLNVDLAAHIEQQGRAFVHLPFGLASRVIEIQTPYLSLETAASVLPRGLGPSNSTIPTLAEASTANEKLTDRQAKILKLWDDGIRVKKSICEQVYGAGKTGGKYYQLVDKVLTEHNRI
jgi:hypothetical protein